MTRDRVIGTRDGMPWDVPEEYQQYLNFIRGHTVIMGRRTYEIFGKDLTSQHTLVVSRSMHPLEGIHLCRSLDEALALADVLGEETFIAGGASVYEQSLDKADAMYLSFIKQQAKGMAYFPEIPMNKWRVIKREEHEAFEFVVYVSKKSTLPDPKL